MKLTFREAEENEVPILVKMFADDKLGSKREDVSEPLNQNYLIAFNQIKADANNELIVAVNQNEIIGMIQLTYIPSLGLLGSKRCIIGGVRVHGKFRGQGLGTVIIKWGIDRAKSKSCKLVQITSDKQRTDAIRFYQKLGFNSTHEGLRLKISSGHHDNLP